MKAFYEFIPEFECIDVNALRKLKAVSLRLPFGVAHCCGISELFYMHCHIEDACSAQKVYPGTIYFCNAQDLRAQLDWHAVVFSTASVSHLSRESVSDH